MEERSSGFGESKGLVGLFTCVLKSAKIKTRIVLE